MDLPSHDFPQGRKRRSPVDGVEVEGLGVEVSAHPFEQLSERRAPRPGLERSPGPAGRRIMAVGTWIRLLIGGSITRSAMRSRIPRGGLGHPTVVSAQRTTVSASATAQRYTSSVAGS